MAPPLQNRTIQAFMKDVLLDTTLPNAKFTGMRLYLRSFIAHWTICGSPCQLPLHYSTTVEVWAKPTCITFSNRARKKCADITPLTEDNHNFDISVKRVHVRKFFTYIVAVSCVLGVLALYSRGDGTHILSTVSSAFGPSRKPLLKDDFITAILRQPVEGLVDPEPIYRKCNETKFQEGLVWHCPVMIGGIGNVANMWLNCMRYAIEAGATTVILPRLGARSENDLIDLGGEKRSVELSTLFDVSYFLDEWKEACPQIRSVVSDSEVPNLNLTATSPRIDPRHVKKFKTRKYLIVDPTGWREAFDIWMGKNSVFKTMSAKNPVRVRQNLVLFEWNREVHPLDFVHSFPRLFQHTIQTRRLAASVLWHLEKNLSHPVVSDTILFSSSPPSKVNSLGPDRLTYSGFMGAHLRVARDAAIAKWPGYEAQAPFYLAEAKRLNLTTIYLATDAAKHRDQFRTDAEREGISVIVKEDLLDVEELAELQSLTWDQQALVDFDVLMYCSWFSGFVRSSFSWMLALRRGTLPEAGTPTITDGEEYRDNLSALVGRHDKINPEGLWP
ncbi:hypothetical protein B7463_g7396, partial [Scytalidium lignicola]